MTDHKIASRGEWQAARDELMRREKEHTRIGDELARERRELPWVRVEKEYRFDTDEGTRTLAELFDGRSQLLVYHFMFGPSYETPCPTCSSMADGFNGVVPHLHARDATMLLVSRAPLEPLQAYKRRMGWSIPWASSGPSEKSKLCVGMVASHAGGCRPSRPSVVEHRKVQLAEALAVGQDVDLDDLPPAP
jgi:predicted dithiol-disulfide oxidoreductase (DUF899 family)